MLTIVIPSVELYDNQKDVFVNTKEQKLQLEHSLVSLSKWESKWCKPFMSKDKKTIEETRDYIRCMTLTQNVDDDIYNYLTPDNIRVINEYMELPMTATTINSADNKKSKHEVYTAEILYYWMISLNIPFECQKWHINRLLTLISVCNLKSNPPKKMSKSEIMNRNRAVNTARKQKLNTKG